MIRLLPGLFPKVFVKLCIVSIKIERVFENRTKPFGRVRGILVHRRGWYNPHCAIGYYAGKSGGWNHAESRRSAIKDRETGR
jgi:hypothetical protein